MSRALMTLTFADQTVLYGIYNGTVDLCMTWLTQTPEEAWACYRAWADEPLDAPEPECTCITIDPPDRNQAPLPTGPTGPEPVHVHNDYGSGSGSGSGSTFEGTACRVCMVYVSPIDPMELYDNID